MDRRRYFKIRSLIHNKYITSSNDVRVFGADQRSHFNCIKGKPRDFHFRNIHCKFIVNVTILIIYLTKLQEKIGSPE